MHTAAMQTSVDVTAGRRMFQASENPGAALAAAVEDRHADLDDIWAAKQLSWEHRTLLLEFHQQGVLDLNDLQLSTVTTLARCGLGEEDLRQLLCTFFERVHTALAGPEQACQDHSWKNRLMLELISKQVCVFPL
jgi:hypothetical protein